MLMTFLVADRDINYSFVLRLQQRNNWRVSLILVARASRSPRAVASVTVTYDITASTVLLQSRTIIRQA